MKQIKTILLMVTAATLLTSIAGCKKDTIKSNQRTFNIEKFKQNLKIQLEDSIVGYSVVIAQNGQFADSIQYGIATSSPSGGGTTPMTMHTYTNIASVTKTLTAIAAIKLLAIKGIPLDSTIGNYLPAYWNATPNVRSITFKELLSHSSGFRETNTSYDSLRAQCVRGLDGPKTRSYANSNFALFRVLLPYINDLNNTKSSENIAVANNNTANFELTLSQRYQILMQLHVFTPCGISNATCDNNAINSSMSNVFSEGTSMTILSNAGDWRETCGGGGYYLTTYQMAQIMGYLMHSTTLLNTEQKAMMNTDLMGWDPEDSPTTSAGKAYGKDGALIWPSLSPSPGLQTYICSYPNKVDVAISINSITGGNFRGISTLALNAYEDSWEK